MNINKTWLFIKVRYIASGFEIDSVWLIVTSDISLYWSPIFSWFAIKYIDRFIWYNHTKTCCILQFFWSASSLCLCKCIVVIHIWYRSDAKVLDRCLTDIDPRVFPICINICGSMSQPLCTWFVFLCSVAMITSSNGNIFHVTGPLCGVFNGHRWIPCTKAINAELWCFLWSAPE